MASTAALSGRPGSPPGLPSAVTEVVAVPELGHFCLTWDSSRGTLCSGAPQWPRQGFLRTAPSPRPFLANSSPLSFHECPAYTVGVPACSTSLLLSSFTRVVLNCTIFLETKLHNKRHVRSAGKGWVELLKKWS